MVNMTAIQEILRFVTEKKIRPMKRWSLRLNSSRSHIQHNEKLKTLIRSLLELISGTDIIAMLQSDNKIRKISADQSTLKFFNFKVF
jgi:hypothetical protein